MTIKAGSDECYVRMIAKITDAADVLAIMGNDFLPQTCVNGWDNTVWVPAGMEVENNEIICEFRYHTTVDASESETNIVLEPLFTELVVPGILTGDQLAKLTDMEIKVEGHAIQTATFDNAEAAWIAFDAQTGN